MFVDTAPVMEKPLAQQAGLGWQGKHTNLVSRGLGSWLFLGEIYLSLALEPDDAESDRCGTCRACLDACPTNAFPQPYRLDARRCISYLTIEHKGPIPHELRPLIGNRIFGCDDCLAACPWNKFARVTEVPEFLARDGLSAPMLAELAGLDDAGFRARFAGTAVKRIGRNRFLRNVLIAIGNAPEPGAELVAAARSCLDDPSPLVRGAAVWAFGRIAGRARSRRRSRRRRDTETRCRGQRGMAPPRPGGYGGGAMILLGRAIGLFVLCILVGMFLESIGITARGILTDTWHTLDMLWQKLRDLVVWSLPYALLGAIIVVPLALLSLVGRLRRRR